MKWSQLKKRIEANFADSVRGRVEVWNTRYRKSHDAEGEAWITIDKKRVQSFGTLSFFVESYHESEQVLKERGSPDWRDPHQFDEYHKAHRDADQAVREKGVLPLWEVNQSLFDYLSLAIDDAITSDNQIIRAVATLDRRFGKRRLRDFDDSREPPLVRTLYRLRCEAEGIKTEPKQSPAGDVLKAAAGGTDERK